MNEITFTETTPATPTPMPKTRMKFKLICASKVKKFALDVSQSNPCQARAKMFTRVSEEFLMACEANLKNFIHSRVKSHPSVGKTLK